MYIQGNPANYVDPSGNLGVCVFGGPPIEGNSPSNTHIELLCKNLGKLGYFGNETEPWIQSNHPSDLLQIADKIEKYMNDNHLEPLLLFGYSYGGAGVLELTHILNVKNVQVDELITIDPVVDPRNGGTVKVGDYPPMDFRSQEIYCAARFDIDIYYYVTSIRYEYNLMGNASSVSKIEYERPIVYIPSNVDRAFYFYATAPEEWQWRLLFSGPLTIADYIEGANNIGLNFDHGSIIKPENIQIYIQNKLDIPKLGTR